MTGNSKLTGFVVLSALLLSATAADAVVVRRGGAVVARPVARPAARGAVVVRRPVAVVRPVYRPVMRPWVRRPYYGTIVAGVALGTLIAVTAAPPPPDPTLCWYWANPENTQGYWDHCA
jgi:hypothetical protein